MYLILSAAIATVELWPGTYDFIVIYRYQLYLCVAPEKKIDWGFQNYFSKTGYFRYFIIIFGHFWLNLVIESGADSIVNYICNSFDVSCATSVM